MLAKNTYVFVLTFANFLLTECSPGVAYGWEEVTWQNSKKWQMLGVEC